MTTTKNSNFKPFCFSALVIHGHGRGGTQLGFPTANAELDSRTTEQLQPYKNLVLYGWGSVVAIPGKESCVEGPYPIATSIGFNPHFNDKELSAEVHFIHEFENDFYGAVMNILVLGVIREMGAYVSLDALVEAITRDITYTTEMLKTSELESYKNEPFLAKLGTPSETRPHFEYLNI